MSPITDLRTGIMNPKFSHVLSFRRQVFIAPADEKKLPERFQVNHDDINYWIYPSCDSLKCFVCKQTGHLAKNCQEKNQNQPPIRPFTETTNAAEVQEVSLRLQDPEEAQSESQSSMELTPATTASPFGGPEQVRHQEKDKDFLVPAPPKVGDKRQHPSTDTTVSSNFSAHIDLEKDTETEADTETDSETTTNSEPENLNNFPDLPMDNSDRLILSKKTNKKRKITKEKEEAYSKAWDSIKSNVEMQGKSGTYVINVDQLRHLMENSSGRSDIRELVKEYTDNVTGIIVMCEAIRPFMTRSIKTRSTKLTNKLKLIIGLGTDTDNGNNTMEH